MTRASRGRKGGKRPLLLAENTDDVEEANNDSSEEVQGISLKSTRIPYHRSNIRRILCSSLVSKMGVMVCFGLAAVLTIVAFWQYWQPTACLGPSLPADPPLSGSEAIKPTSAAEPTKPATTAEKPTTEAAKKSNFMGLSRNTSIERLANVAITYGEGMNQSSGPPSTKCPAVKGRRILINYAANCCKVSQPLNCKTGLEVGGFDMCVSFSDKSVDDDFRTRNIKTFMISTGAGLWLWKPYIILKTLLAMGEDDVLMYSDSGCKIIANMDQAHVCLQAQLNQDVVLFAYEAPERLYSKADAFFLMNCEFGDPACSNTTQFLGSPILLRKTFRSIQFVSQWLTYSQDYRITGNEPSTFHKDQQGFVANRNDQTVLSLLAKKWGISPWPDPSQWGENSYGQSLKKQTKFTSLAKTFMDLTRDKF